MNLYETLKPADADLFRVLGINIAAFTVSLTEVETAIRILGLLAALVYTLLKIVDWVAARRGKRKAGGDLLPIWIVLAGLSVSGCSGVPRGMPGPSTVPVARAVQGADAAAGRVRASVERARTAVRGADAPLKRLGETATPAQRGDLVLVANTFRTLDRELGAARLGLRDSAVAHSQALANVTTLQGRIDGLADDLGRAQDAERKGRERVAFWRAWALRLGGLSALLLLWCFRRPILRLCGVPAL